MANPYLVLWCNPNTNTLMSGWNDPSVAQTPILKQGDTIGVEVHWVSINGATGAMSEHEFPPSSTVSLAIGLLDTAPSNGTFKLSYGGQTTIELNYNASATDVEAALNNLSTIAADGGVSVTKTNNQYRVVWDEKGVFSDPLTCDTDNLSPTSNFSSIEAKAGSATASRVLLIKLYRAPVAGTSSFTTIASPAIQINEVSDRLYRIDISPTPKNGSFQLNLTIGTTTYTTLPIYVQSTKDYVLQTILRAISAIPVSEQPQITVNNYGTYGYEIYSQATGTEQPISGITAVNNLNGFSALYGTMSMNTAGVEELVAGNAGADAVLEVQADIAGEVQTLIQTNVIILNDLIETSSFDLVDLGSVMPVDSVVRYDTSQALTSAQKLQARQNIDAIDGANITQIETDINVLQGQIVAADSEITALQAADAANINQPVKTTSDVQFKSVNVVNGANTLAIAATGITFPDSTVLTTAITTPNLSVYMQKASNLSDVASVSTARTNLGLGTMAVATATDYLNKAGNLSGLASAATARTNLGLGTAATQNSTAFDAAGAAAAVLATSLQKSSNLSDVTSPSSARSNLGLGTMATETATNYLAKSGNLSGLSNASTARTNLGLGTSDSVQFYGVTTGSLTFSGDSTVQTTASANAPSDTTKGYMQIWNTNSWSATESFGGTGVLWNDPLTNTISEFGATSGTNGVPAIKISGDGGTTWTEFTANGIVFPDGTTQTTSISSDETHNMLAFDWTEHYDQVGGWTFTDSGSVKKMNTSVGTSFAYASMMCDARGLMAPKQAGYGKVRAMKMKFAISGWSNDHMFMGLFGTTGVYSEKNPLFGLSIANGDVLNWNSNIFIYIKGSGAPEWIDTGISILTITQGGSWNSNTFKNLELDLNPDGSLEFRAYPAGGTSPMVFQRGAQTALYNQALKSALEYGHHAGISLMPANPSNESNYYPAIEVGKFMVSFNEQ